MTFIGRTQEIAASFLQSAIVFDDQADFESASAAIPEPPENVLVDDGGDTGDRPQVLIEPSLTPEPDGELGINAKVLSDAFAREGLICGFLKPQKDDAEAVGGLVEKAARRADIVVLDWSINRDEGQATLGVIEQILSADAEQEEERLRLIAIYTSRLEPTRILERISETVEPFLSGHQQVAEDFAIRKGPVRVTLYAKVAPHLIGTQVESRIRTEAELPGVLIREFAEMTAGLVPLVAMAGLAAIRGETHRILAVLNGTLDPAYLGQRILIPDQAEAGEHLVDLLTSELRSVMEDRKVSDRADGEAIQDWVRWKLERGESMGIGLGSGNEEANVAALLRHGLSESAASEAAEITTLREELTLSRKNQIDRATRLFTPDESTADEANASFAMRVSLRTRYRNPPRVLQLGTVVRDHNGEFMLCVQPVCDSVRMSDGERAFPFLPAAPNDDRFDLIVQDPDADVRRKLLVVRRPYRLRLIRFNATAGTDWVQAIPTDGGFEFRDSDDHPYRWVAQVENAYGQRFAHALGNELSRIGMNEFEWLRKKQKGDG